MPLGVEPLPGVGVLVEMGAVEERETVGVVREVRRHPVEDDPDTGLVQDVDEVHEVLRLAVPGGRREIPRRLIAPRAVERMLRHGHELDVGKPQSAHVLRQLVRSRAVRQVAPVSRAAPRSEMDLVDRYRRPERVAGPTRREPVLVAPLVLERPRARRRARRDLREERERIGLVDAVAAVPGLESILVALPASHVRDHRLPDAAPVRPRAERMRLRVPVVEIADDRNATRVGRPQGEPGGSCAELASHPLVQAAMRALAEEVEVLMGEEKRVGGVHGVTDPEDTGVPSSQTSCLPIACSSYTRCRKDRARRHAVCNGKNAVWSAADRIRTSE